MFDASTRVLVVDDMKTMRSIVKNTLRQLGFSDFTEAENGQQAWDVLSSANPPIQLIVSDWNMPEMTGLELLKMVRERHANKAIPFLMVTAEGEKGQILEALKLGVSNYVLKPFTADTLAKKIREMRSPAA